METGTNQLRVRKDGSLSKQHTPVGFSRPSSQGISCLILPNPREKIKITKRTHFDFWNIRCARATYTGLPVLTSKKRTHFAPSPTSDHFLKSQLIISQLFARSSKLFQPIQPGYPSLNRMLDVRIFVGPKPRNCPKYQLPSPGPLIAYWAFPEVPERKRPLATLIVRAGSSSVADAAREEAIKTLKTIPCSAGCSVAAVCDRRTNLATVTDRRTNQSSNQRKYCD
jgi:hypothetical protein